MAPIRPAFKTYSRKPIQHRRSSSVDVVDALFAENICRRKEAASTKPRQRKTPIIIKDLPPPDENHHLIDDSVCRNWGLDDTFDRLRKEPVHNNLKPACITASDHSTSNSRIILTNSVHSPIIHNTRGYKKRLVYGDESSQNNIITKKEERTLDKSVNESLAIEKVPKFAKPKEISYLSSPSVLKSDGSVPPQMRSVANQNEADISYEPLFSRTFMETVGSKLHIASTPAVPSSTPCKSTLLVNETISPILNNSQPKSLIESYEEIQRWNFKPPDFELDELCCNDTPKVKRKKQLLPKKLQKKKDILKHKIVNEKVISSVFTQKIPSYKEKPDWKLKAEAKVVLDNCLDVIGIEKSVKFGNLDEPTLGFSSKEMRASLARRVVVEESLKKMCLQHNNEFEDTNVQSPVRYIALRKRKVPIVCPKPKTEKTDLGLSTHRQIKPSTNSQELDVNNKPIFSKQRNSIQRDSSSLEPDGIQSAIIHESQEPIPNSAEKINDLSPNREPNFKKKSRKVSELNTVADSVLSANNENHKNLNKMENETTATEISVFNDFKRPCSISLKSPSEPDAVNSIQVQNTEELDEVICNKIASPDIIPSTPPVKVMFNRPTYKNAMAESCIEISTDCSKSENDAKQENISNSPNTTRDFTKDTNSPININPNEVDNIDKDEHESSFSDISGIINNNSGLYDEVEGSIFTESDNRLNKNLQKYMKHIDSDTKNVSLILEDHNYSKVLTYSEVIEVSSSDEEDPEDDMQNKSTSSKLNTSCSSIESKLYHEDKVCQSNNLNSSLSDEEDADIQNNSTSSKLNVSCISIRSKNYNINKIESVSISVNSSTSDEEDIEENIQNNSTSPKLNACIAVKSEYYNKDKISESENVNSSSADEEDTNENPQNNSICSKSNVSCIYIKSKYYNKHKVSEPENFNSSDEEEDTNENIQYSNASSNASCISIKSRDFNKDTVLEPEGFNSSSEITPKCNVSPKSKGSFSSLKVNCNRNNEIVEGDNNSKDVPECSSKKDSNEYTSANNSDDELDFSEFIVSTEQSLLDVQQNKAFNDTTGPSIQSTNLLATSTAEAPFKTPALLCLKPGKLWRRSLLTVRKSFLICDPIVCKADSGCICTCATCRQKNSTPSRVSRRMSVKIIAESPHPSFQHGTSLLENYASVNITYGSNTIQDAVHREKSIGETLLVRNNSIHESLPVITPSVTARDIVLRRCGQPEPISFTECYPSSVLKNCFKIGEGVYGEVFLFKSPDGGSRVMKVIPIEGAQMVNGEHQKKFEEIISEIIIAMELTDLRNGNKNKTEGFSKVEKIRCVQGRYPERLLELWELFDETRGSENDSPEIFTESQLYIVLELANGGKDMEAFIFNNALQAFSMFKQVACALAVAETSLQFEHRDLHWGNVLIYPTDRYAEFTYCLNGNEFKVPTAGVGVSIIDFTLSRITYDGVCIFNDLSADPDLFSATGDYQFEIYKMMQKHNNNEWQDFKPYSNVLWLHYLLDKMATALRYKNTNTLVHKEGIAKIKELKHIILNYRSAEDVVKNEFLS